MGLAELRDFLDNDPEPPKGDQHGVVKGAVLDTLGLTDRPGAKTTGQLLVNPQGVTEHAIQAAVTAPAIAAGGAGLGALASRILPRAAAAVAPAVGRVLTSGGIGAGKAAARGESPLKEGVMDAAAAAVPEAVLGVGGGLANRLAGGADALAAVREQIGRGASGPLNLQLLDMMVQRIQNAANPVARETALRNAVEQINRMVPGLGRDFKRLVANFTAHVPGVRSVSAHVPPGASQAAATVRGVTQNPGVRAAADAGATTVEDSKGVPGGLLAGKALSEHTPLGRIAGALLR